MNPTHAKKTPRAAIGALALAIALALPASTLAATSQQVSESFSVQSTLSISVDTNSVAYTRTDGSPAILAGDKIYAPIQVTASTNDADGLTLNGSGSALTNGSATIPASARSFKVNNGTEMAGATFSYPAGTTLSTQVTSFIQLPSDASAGTWAGTLTLSVSDN